MTWYDNDYGFKKKITIDHTLVAGNETNFPVLVSVTDNDLRDEANSGHVKSADGYDIIFTNGDEDTQLKHEIERYVNTDGTLVFWVKIDSLSSTVDTDFYIYYGKAGVGADPSSTDTWDANYKLVCHLDDPNTGTNVDDSTANGNDGTKKANAEPSRTAGKTGYGQDFDGSDDYIDWGNIGDTCYGCSFWMKPDSLIDKTSAARELLNISLNYFKILTGASTGLLADETLCIQKTSAGDDRVAITDNISNAWHLITITWDGSEYDIYIDGSLGTIIRAGTLPLSTMISVKLGKFAAATPLATIHDEFRIFINSGRSANWISTQYETQSDPAGFMDWGVEETGAIKHAPSDTVSISDLVTFKRLLDLNDTTGVSDNIVYQHEIALVDTISASDDVVFKHSLTLSDAIGISDAATFKRLLDLVDSVGISDVTIFKHLISLADTLTMADAAIFKHVLSFADAIGVSDTVTFKRLLNLVDSVNVSDITVFKHFIALDDTIALSDSIVYKHLIALADSIGISEEAIFKHFISLLDAISTDDSIIYKHSLFLSDSFTIYDGSYISMFILDNVDILDEVNFNLTESCYTIFKLEGDSHSVLLPRPEYASESGTLNNNLVLFDFWLGERSLVHIELDSEPFTLSGTIFACSDNKEVEMTAIATKFLNIHEMMDNNEKITITGLNNCVDAVYVIKDFKYRTIRKSPYAYTWQLSLEYVRAI